MSFCSAFTKIRICLRSKSHNTSFQKHSLSKNSTMSHQKRLISSVSFYKLKIVNFQRAEKTFNTCTLQSKDALKIFINTAATQKWIFHVLHLKKAQSNRNKSNLSHLIDKTVVDNCRYNHFIDICFKEIICLETISFLQCAQIIKKQFLEKQNKNSKIN